MYLYAGGGVRQDLAIPLIARRVCWPSLSSHAVSVLAISIIARRVIMRTSRLTTSGPARDSREARASLSMGPSRSGRSGPGPVTQAASRLGCQSKLMIVGHVVQELYEAKFGAGSFSGTSHRQDERRPCELEDAGAAGPGPSSRGRDEAAQPAP